jgi:hypothetical protein
VAKTTAVTAFTHRRPARNPFPEHLPRERVVVPGPITCLCCGGGRLRKAWGDDHRDAGIDFRANGKVIQYVRESAPQINSRPERYSGTTPLAWSSTPKIGSLHNGRLLCSYKCKLYQGASIDAKELNALSS